MDAMNLALPTNTLASVVMGSGTDPALNTKTDDAPIDFATLVAAAGLDPQQLLPQTPIEDAQTSALLSDPAAMLADKPPQLPVPSVLAAQLAESGQRLAQLTAPPRESASTTSVFAAATHTVLAADAASIAAQTTRDDTLRQPGGAADLDTALSTQADAMANLAATVNESTSVGEATTRVASILQPIEQRAATPSTAVLQVSAHVSSPGFADALSHQVVWMVDKDAQVAELRINPPELGPVQVRLTVAGGEATAQFVSTHAEVRTAIETSIARLRESLAEAGIQLGQASVSAESFRDQTPEQAVARQAHSRYGNPGENADEAVSARPAPTLRGLVDTFA
jgi:flagellar hook-length control protein FliK